MDFTKIISIFEPTIELEELSIIDFESEESGIPPHKPVGIDISIQNPVIKINDYMFHKDEIDRFSIDSTGFIPKINLRVKLIYGGEFLSDFIKDGDLIQIYISGKDNLFKPIRNDYLITSVESNSSKANPEGENITLDISGELNIPHLYDEIISVENSTSFEAFKNIAKKLKLGFATNVTSTDDLMKWICANDTYINFLKHIIGAAWLNENSFFTFFIDVYYHINFINVNSLIKYNQDMLVALNNDTTLNTYYNTEGLQKGLIEKCFSNHPALFRSNFYIKNFKPINRSSEIVKKYGYAFNGLFFDHESNKIWQLQAKTLITPGIEKEKIILRGRAGDDSYNDLQKFNYLGIQYNAPHHNVHENFFYARIHNMMNNLELEKIIVEISIDNFNFNIYRYENIPAVFIVRESMRRIVELNKSKEDVGIPGDDNFISAAIDHFFTGYYLIKGLIIDYKKNNDTNSELSDYTEKIYLTRREWPSPTGV